MAEGGHSGLQPVVERLYNSNTSFAAAVCVNKRSCRSGTLLSFLPLVPFSVAESKAFEEAYG